MADVDTVSIKIEVTDNAQPAIAGVTASLNQMGAAGAMTGAKMEKAMAGATVGTKTAASAAEQFRTRMSAAMAAYEAQSKRGKAVSQFLGEEFDRLSKNNPAVMAFEQAAAAAAAYTPIANEAAAATRRVVGGSGEARIAASAMTGSIRGMGYGLANVIGQSKMLGPVLKAAMPVMVAGASIGLLVDMGMEVYNLYEKWLDVDSAIEKYNDKASAAASKQFYQNAGINELIEDLKEASAQIDQLNQTRANSPGWFKEWATTWNLSMWGDLGKNDPKYFGMKGANQLDSAQGRSDQARLKVLEDEHKKALEQIQDRASLTEARSTGTAKNRIELNASNREADENQIYNIARQQILHEITTRPGRAKPGEEGYVPAIPAPTATAHLMGLATQRIEQIKQLQNASPQDSYQAEKDLAKAHAAAEFRVKESAIERQHAEELRRIHEQALESALHGSALYHQQEAAAIEDLKQKGIASAQAVNDIRARYHNEEMDRLREQRAATEQIQMRAAMTGWTGIARIQAEGDISIGGVRGDQNLPDEEKEKRVAAIKQQTNAEILDAERQFTQRVNDLADESAQHQIGGFARIRAEAQKQIRGLRQDYEKLYGSNPNDPQYKAHIGDLNKGVKGYQSIASDQAAELARRNADETERIEAQARIHSLSGEKQRTASIQAEYDERLRKYQEEKHAELASGKLTAQEMASVWDNYNRRVAAAGQERDSDMVAAATAAREKMAGQFTSFFSSLDHPKEALAALGEKVAGETAASLVQRIQNPAAAGMPGMPGIHGADVAGVFGDLFGAHKATHSPMDEKWRPGGGSQTTAAGVFSVAQATIHVGNAMIAGGSGASGGGYGAYAGGSGTSSSGFGGWGGSSYTGGSSGARFTPAVYHPGSMPGGGGFSGAGVNGGVGGGAMSDISSGIGLVGQARGIFKSGAPNAGGGRGDYADVISPQISGGFNKSGTYQSSPGGSGWNQSMLGGGGVGSNAAGAAGGALGMFSAYEGNGGVGGALSGAMSGMKLGMAIGGPMGAAVGAAAGAIVGAIGFGGREKAHVYDLKTVRPRIGDDTQSYEQGGMDYLTAYSDMLSLDMEAKKALYPMGPAGGRYYKDTVEKEIKDAERKFTSMEKAGRSRYTATAAQFAEGTDSVPRDGLAVIHHRERIVPSDQNERITRALEGGAGSTRMPAQSGFGGDIHFHVSAIDSRSVDKFFNENGHRIRASLNKTYAENSGGSDMY